MIEIRARSARCRSGMRWFALLGVMLFVLVGSTQAFGETSVTVVRVEEDWELVIREPAPNRQAPQITCVIAPTSDVEMLHTTFEINHRTQPDFQHGGMQLQIWQQKNLLLYKTNEKQGLLDQAAEAIRWTQGMNLSDGKLTFEITKGASAKWGAFGGLGRLKAVGTTTITSLNGYDPDVSVKNSGIGFGANRITSLILKRVRYYSASGLISEDSTPRVVFQHE